MFNVKVVNEEYIAPGAYNRVGNYIINCDKCDGYFGSYGAFTYSPYWIENSMIAVYNRRSTTEEISCLFHVIYSIKSIENAETIDDLFKLAGEISKIIGGEFQNIYAVHYKNDGQANCNEHPHIHFMINAVSWVNGRYIPSTDSGRAAMYSFVNSALMTALKNLNSPFAQSYAEVNV